MKIDIARLCWYTRGRLWDYTILCRPHSPNRPGWLSLLEKIFQGTEASLAPCYLAGTIHWEAHLGKDPSPYVAVSFVDPERHDRDKRQIVHQLFYLLGEQDRSEFGDGWHQRLLEALAEPYNDIFPLHARDLRADHSYTTIFDEEKLLTRFDDKLKQLTPCLEIPTPPEPVRWQKQNWDVYLDHRALRRTASALLSLPIRLRRRLSLAILISLVMALVVAVVILVGREPPPALVQPADVVLPPGQRPSRSGLDVAARDTSIDLCQAPPDGSPPDGSPPDGSPPDGSPPDGSPPDGSPQPSPPHRHSAGAGQAPAPAAQVHRSLTHPDRAGATVPPPKPLTLRPPPVR